MTRPNKAAREKSALENEMECKNIKNFKQHSSGAQPCYSFDIQMAQKKTFQTAWQHSCTMLDSPTVSQHP